MQRGRAGGPAKPLEVVPARPAEAEPAPAGAAPAPAAAGGSLRATLWVSSTYFAEGLPYAIVHKVASEFFTAAGASLQAIGLTSFFGLPWNFKFLWSPLVDMYGTTRTWLILTELVLAAAVFALAWPADAGALTLMAGGFVAVAVAAATHDIAIDGFYLAALDKDRQASFSGLRVGAYRLALLAGALLVALAGWVSWRVSFAAAGLLLAALAGLHAVNLPRPGASSSGPAAPAPKRSARFFVGAFATFLRQPKGALVLAFIVLYRAGDALMFAMSSPLLKALGLDTTARGLVAGVGTVASIAGSLLGGLLIARRGFARTIVPIATLQSLAILLYVALAYFQPPLPWVVALVVLEQLAAGVGTAVLMVFLMRRCKEPYKASHFAIGSALMSVAATVAGGFSGYLASWAGFPVFFGIAFLASLPGVMLSRVVPTA